MLSRAEEIEGICIVQPHAPNLFRNGDLPGPDLLLKFQRGVIEQADLEAAWGKQSKKVRKPSAWHWLNEMPLYWRGCSETAAAEVYKAAKEFPNHGLQYLWDRVIALGMARFCKQCSNARKAAAGKVHGLEVSRPSQEDAEVECVGCRLKLPLQAFDVSA